MRYAQILITLLALCGLSQCAGTPKQADNQADDQMVCRDEEVVGSRITKRVCETPEQAKQREIESQMALERFQRSNSVIIK